MGVFESFSYIRFSQIGQMELSGLTWTLPHTTWLEYEARRALRPTVDIEVEETPTVPAIPTVLPDLRFTTGPMLRPL